MIISLIGVVVIALVLSLVVGLVINIANRGEAKIDPMAVNVIWTIVALVIIAILWFVITGEISIP